MRISRQDADTYTAICASSATMPGFKSNFVEYDVTCCCSGQASCSCPDFQAHGGACKHLRALRHAIDLWISTGYETPFVFPQNPEEAARYCSYQLNSAISKSSTVTTGKSLSLKCSCKTNPSLKAAYPLLPTASTLAWDSYLIQALGDDPTILGHSDEGSCDSTDKVHHDGSDSLSESVSDVTLEEPGHLVPVENNSSVTVIPSA